MSQGQQRTSSTILVFEPDASLRRLLTLGLLHRGLHVIEIDSLASLEKVGSEQIDLLLLDVDNAVSCDWSLLETISSRPGFAPVPAVVLAWELPTTKSNDLVPALPVHTRFLPKPFDARILHETIEELAAAPLREQQAREAQMEAALLAVYSNHTAPSAWPFITAAGLFLLVVGLLLQPALAIVGGLIVVASLLLWTLGGPPAETRVALSVSRP